MEFIIDLDVRPGEFYEVPNGYFMPIKDQPMKTSLTICKKLPVSCMFDIYIVQIGTERVGFYFTTRFEVTNGGSYLLTALKNKGVATEVEVLIKTDDLVVYNYPNRGTLAITPLVSDEISTIFQEQ